jgi:hypothetical protein
MLTQLTELIAICVGLIWLIRFVVRTLGLSEAGFASLFVPPDRALGWPHGVQESDAPWGWRPPIDPIDQIDGEGTDPVADFPSGAPDPLIVRTGSYVEPTRPVAPVRFRGLPQ